jgi:two-component system chemotaxis response regulator CheY
MLLMNVQYRRAMTLKALVVDDSEFQRNIISNALDGWVNVIGTAENGIEAVEQYKSHKPDFVTMDIMMPEMNGLKALRVIKEIYPNAVVIMLTSVSQKEKMRKAARHGADGYVTKPFDSEELFDEIEDAHEVGIR